MPLGAGSARLQCKPQGCSGFRGEQCAMWLTPGAATEPAGILTAPAESQTVPASVPQPHLPPITQDTSQPRKNTPRTKESPWVLPSGSTLPSHPLLLSPSLLAVTNTDCPLTCSAWTPQSPLSSSCVTQTPVLTCMGSRELPVVCCYHATHFP